MEVRGLSVVRETFAICIRLLFVIEGVAEIPFSPTLGFMLTSFIVFFS